MTTANQIIQRALVKSRVIAPGESVPADKANQILDELNDLLESWSLEGLMVPADTLESFTLVSGKEEYEYGPDGDFDSSRPIRIKDETFIRVGSIDYRIKLYPLDVYRRVKDKYSEGYPQMMAYHPEDTLGKVFIWPVPQVWGMASYVLTSDDSTIYSGTAVFGGASGVVVTIGETLDSDDYLVFVQPLSTDPVNIGPISVENKTTTTFTVFNTGSDTITEFDWILIDKPAGSSSDVTVSTGIDIYFRATKQLTEFSALTTDVTLPVGYRRAIIHNLALEIGPNFGKKPSPSLVALSRESLRTIKSYHSQVPRIAANPDLRRMAGGRGTYNILSGY